MLLPVVIDLLDLSAEPFSTNGVVNRMYIPADCHMTVTLGQVRAQECAFASLELPSWR